MTGQIQAPGVAKSVLLVDDNRLSRMMFENFLQQLGVETKCVENGQEAVDVIVNGYRPSLILMDVEMPVMDGIEATQHIRQWEKEHLQRSVPIIAVTGNAYLEDRSRCLAAGMNEFLAKPVGLQHFKDVLDNWMAK